jgi:hypothetical protein
MLWLTVVVLIVLWSIGWGFHVAADLIHGLLILALVLPLINLFLGRRTV